MARGFRAPGYLPCLRVHPQVQPGGDNVAIYAAMRLRSQIDVIVVYEAEKR